MGDQNRPVLGKALNSAGIARKVLHSADWAGRGVSTKLTVAQELCRLVEDALEQLLGDAARGGSGVQQGRERNPCDVNDGLAIVARLGSLVQDSDHLAGKLSQALVDWLALFHHSARGFGTAVKKRRSAFFNCHKNVVIAASTMFL